MESRNLDTLPNEILLAIFLYLNIRDIVNIMRVNKHFYNVTHDEASYKNLSYQFCEIIYPNSPEDQIILKQVVKEQSTSQSYSKLYNLLKKYQKQLTNQSQVNHDNAWWKKTKNLFFKSNSNTEPSFFQQAKQYEKENNYAEALATIEKSIKEKYKPTTSFLSQTQYPPCEELILDGDILCKLNRHQDSFNSYQHAAIFSDSYTALEKMADAKLRLKQHDAAAIKFYNDALTIYKKQMTKKNPDSDFNNDFYVLFINKKMANLLEYQKSTSKMPQKKKLMVYKNNQS